MIGHCIKCKKEIAYNTKDQRRKTCYPCRNAPDNKSDLEERIDKQIWSLNNYTKKIEKQS